MSAVDSSYIDLQPATLAQQGDRIRDIPGDPQVKSDVVARAGGDDAEGRITSDHGPYDAVDRPVAARHDDQLDARLDGVMDNVFKLAVRAYGIDFGQDLLILHF